MLVSPTAIMIPTTAPDDMSRATELAFTEGEWVGDGPLLPDAFGASALGLACAAALEGAGVLPAAAKGLEVVLEVASWLTATPEGLFVELRSASE
jgi:hypothetical protein